jgi:hypothetical protein
MMARARSSRFFTFAALVVPSWEASANSESAESSMMLSCEIFASIFLRSVNADLLAALNTALKIAILNLLFALFRKLSDGKSLHAAIND